MKRQTDKNIQKYTKGFEQFITKIYDGDEWKDKKEPIAFIALTMPNLLENYLRMKWKQDSLKSQTEKLLLKQSKDAFNKACGELILEIIKEEII